MLHQLQIENVAIIDKLQLSLFEGFNVLTGETGAGKSILIDSLNALLGSRVSRELIRSGAEKAVVQGLFSHGPELNGLLEELGIEPSEDGTLLISRTFTDAGKNICRVNGTMVTVAMLRDIGQRLVDIHGQHDNQSLLRPETHIELLDLFSGEELIREKTAYQARLQELQTLKAKLRSLSGEGKERERTLDMLRFQIEEIERANLYLGEDEELMRQSSLLSHAEEIIESLALAYDRVKGEDSEEESALDKLGAALSALQKIEDYDPQYASFASTLTEIVDKLTDLSRELRYSRDGLEYDPKHHKIIEDRISLIQGLKRKYGESIADILDFLKDSKEKLDQMERSEELIIALNAEIKALEEDLHRRCATLNALRKKAAKVLEQGIAKELADLEMPKTQFAVVIESCPQEGFTPEGTDKVEFVFSPNPGEPLRPLSKIASGGEMSRVMLAIKSILAHTDAIPSLIFDEIDTGVSGKAASKVGEKLKNLARNHQVLCITHHAQIASLAHAHFLIQKGEQSGRTLTSVTLLDEGNREKEITRLLSGEHATDAARSLARELLKQGRNGA